MLDYYLTPAPNRHSEYHRRDLMMMSDLMMSLLIITTNREKEGVY